MHEVDNILSRLRGVKGKSGSHTGYMAQCPAHHDDSPSLSVDVGSDGRVLLKCFAGCEVDDILGAIGLDLPDLFPKEGSAYMDTSTTKKKEGHSQVLGHQMPAERGPQWLSNASDGGNGDAGGAHGIILDKPNAVYKYKDEAGNTLYEVCRYQLPGGKKTFRQRKITPTGYEWNLDGVRRVLYRLPELISASTALPVIVVEGEKDVKRLERERVLAIATTNVGGAGKWREEYNQYFAGRDVVIIPDNDDTGASHADMLVDALVPVACSVKRLRLPGLPLKGDVSDWFDAGHTADELARIIQNTPHVTRAALRTQGFEFTTLGDLMTEPVQDIDWLVDGLLTAGGVSIMVARPKVGKSTLARNLCLSVARGTPFLGRACVPGAAVYLALEEKRGAVAQHFSNMGATGQERILIHTGGAPQGQAIAELAEAIVALDAKLAIVDPLIRFTRFKDVNDYAEVYKVLGQFVDLARSTGCHIMLLHHANKSLAEGTATVMGSVGFTGNVDTTLMLNRNYETGQRTVFTEQRYGEDMPPTVLYMDTTSGAVESLGEVDVVQLHDAMRNVLDFLSKQEYAVGEKAIRQGALGDSGRIGRAIRQLVEEGKVIREGTGRKNNPYVFRVDASFSIARLSLYRESLAIENDGFAKEQVSRVDSPDSPDSRGDTHDSGGLRLLEGGKSRKVEQSLEKSRKVENRQESLVSQDSPASPVSQESLASLASDYIGEREALGRILGIEE